MKPLVFLANFIFLFSCERSRSDVNSSGASPTPIISQADAETFGFRSLASRTAIQLDWDRKKFGASVIFEQDIKSLTEMKGHSLLYPHFTIIRETYQTPEQASMRVQRLKEHDSKIDSKKFPKLLLRKGFSAGTQVLIITTDAVIFSYDELDKITRNLELRYDRSRENSGDN